ncbi:hypothetical protein GWD52_13760 [Enterobacteriaceae bacterium 4M9]|nr:hypothetical protein [Enterobacteriaceae bacterium 4M9]
MDADIISIETMIATKQAAQWAFYSMLAAVASAGITGVTAWIAKSALNSWREQESVQEIKNFINAVYAFTNSFIDAPESMAPHIKLSSQDEKKSLIVFEKLTFMSVCLSQMTNAQKKALAAQVYLDMAEINKKYREGKQDALESIEMASTLMAENEFLLDPFS